MKDSIFVPRALIQEVLAGARSHTIEKQRIQETLQQNQQRIQLLKARIHEIGSLVGQLQSPQLSANDPQRQDSKSHSPEETKAAQVRDEQVEAVKERLVEIERYVHAIREISSPGDYNDVIQRTLKAAQTLVKANKYSVGILSERRNIVEIFSIKPGSRPEDLKFKGYISEGVVSADSGTTYGRVILTGKALEIEDFYSHENYDMQMKSLGFNPHALLCVPIHNGRGSVVGVLQVVSMAYEPFSKETPNSFTSTDKKRLEDLACIVGTPIWNLALSRERRIAQNRIEGLLKLHRNISAEAVTSVVLDQVLKVCHELIGTERIGLFVKLDGEEELFIANAADVVRGEYVSIHKGIVGFVARTGETVMTNDAYSNPYFDATLDAKTGFVTRRILCVPVRNPDGKILAVLSAVNKVDNTDFTSEDAVFLNYAADTVGVSLYKASLHHEVRTSQKLIEARLKLTTFISEGRDVTDFVDVVMEIGTDLMECDRFGLLLIDHFKQELWITTKTGTEPIRSPLNRGISGLVATTGQTVCVRDAYQHELFDRSVDAKTGYRTTSVLCTPIFEDRALGQNPKVIAVAMCINKKDGHQTIAFDLNDRQTLQRFCEEIQCALGRLSIEIAYFKISSDCHIESASASANTTASMIGIPSTTTNKTAASELMLAEPDLVNSIIQQYHVDVPLTSSSTLGLIAVACPGAKPGKAPSTRKSEDESSVVPFPREIAIREGDPLDKWDRDTLGMINTEISKNCALLFRAYGFLEAFHISNEKFATFATNVTDYYRANPFHNIQHGFQVLLATHTIIRTEGRRFFSGIEIFSMFIAALCHDIDHPGNTNDFELKMMSPTAMTHNDDAVLERHHCRVTFIILNHKSAKILQHLDAERFKRVRQLIITCILATDMSHHFEKCKLLESLTRRQLAEKRSLLMGVLIHAADLSFFTLPFDQYNEWNKRLLNEFENQAKIEAENGVSSDVFMTNLDDEKTRLIVQLNFINYVARPVWLPLTSLLHHLRFYADSLQQNFDRCCATLDKLQQREGKEKSDSR